VMNIDITRLLPAFILADKNGLAIAKAIEAMLQYMCDVIKNGIDIVLDIDRMPEWRLDEAAWEMNITWYDSEADIESKRQQLKSAQEYSGKIGTPAALMSAIESVFGEGTLREWFEYGGEPYHFNITTTNASALIENRERIMRLIDIVGNVRSVLDNIYYSGDTATADIGTGTAIYSVSGEIHITAK